MGKGSTRRLDIQRPYFNWKMSRRTERRDSDSPQCIQELPEYRLLRSRRHSWAPASCLRMKYE